MTDSKCRVVGKQALIINDLVNAATSKKFSFHILDASPGTGKTFTVSHLYEELQKVDLTMGFVVYTRNLANAFNNTNHTFKCCLTVCKFVMNILHVPFEKYKTLFKTNPTDICFKDLLWNMYRLAFSVASVTTHSFTKHEEKAKLDLLVVDEYTVISPLELIFLYFVCRRFDIVLLVCGDRNQQNSITSCPFLSCNNFAVVNELCDSLHELDVQHRSTDLKHTTFLTALKNSVIDSRYNTPMGFKEKLFVYKHLHEKFSKPLSQNNIYLASYHKDIKARLKQCNHTKMPLVTQVDGEIRFFNLPEVGNYLTYLPLIVGALYQYGVSSTLKIGRLVQFDIDSLTFDSHGKVTKLERGTIDTCIHGNIAPLLKKKYPDQTFLQFNARLMFVTYHVMQGMTVPEDYSLDLNLDGMSINAIYVGLSRVIKPEQINSISSVYTESLKYTHQKDDGWYYLLGKNQSKRFKKCDTYDEFDRYVSGVKFDSRTLTVVEQKDQTPPLIKSLRMVPCDDMLCKDQFLEVVQ